MPGKALIKNHLHEDLKEEELRELNEYCKSLGWDCKKLQLSLVYEGIKNEALYLEEPNSRLIDTLARFLPLPDASIFVIFASDGFGKTSAKDFAARTLNFSDDYYISTVNGSGKTSFQLLKEVLRDLTSINKTPRTLDLVWKELMMILFELKEGGITTVIWIDDAEKLDSKDLLILRALAGSRTFSGAKVCKVILTGSSSLKKKTDNLFEQNLSDTEEAEAHRAFFYLELEKWKADHIFSWWELLSEFCSTTEKAFNPFEKKASEVVLKFSKGNPRVIMQLTRHVFFEKARTFQEKGTELWITEDDISKNVSEI